MKRILEKLAAIVLVAATLASVCLATDSDIKITVDGSAIEAPAIAVEGRTLIPVRDICEALGATVVWDSTDNSVTISKALYSIGGASGELSITNRSVTLWIGEKTVWIDGAGAEDLDVGAQLSNGKTMVPVRAISQWFGATVTWDQDTQTVAIERALNGSVAEAELYRDMIYKAEQNAIDRLSEGLVLTEEAAEWVSEYQLESECHIEFNYGAWMKNRGGAGFYAVDYPGDLIYSVPDLPEKFGFGDDDATGTYSGIQMKFNSQTNSIYFNQADLVSTGVLPELSVFETVIQHS